MPTSVAVHLARGYHGEISRLAKRFGGYAAFWLYCAERLMEEDRPTDERLSYPLYESRLWREWDGAAGISPQSGPLYSVRTASP